MAYPNSFRCVVATPTRQLFAGDIYYADVPGYSGHYGVISDHENLVATNHQGGKLELWLDPEGKEKKTFLIHMGCSQMLHNHLAVLARFGKEIEDLELERSKRRAEEVRAEIEKRKAEMSEEDSDEKKAADEAWIITENIHAGWHEAQVNFIETGKESYLQ